ncbi:MAG: BON domain-containing protein [Rubrivivax sp.]
MIIRPTLAALITSVALLGTVTGCSVIRDQQSTGAYFDDSVLTTEVKAKMVADKTVDAAAIGVDTLNGTVMLSGFAKSSTERNMAEKIASNVKGVKSVKNQIVVRP